jgi:hypothetical protein
MEIFQAFGLRLRSLGIVREQLFEGYLEARGHRLFDLSRPQKKGLRQVWYCSSEPLRQEVTADTGSVVRGCPSLSGGRGKARILSGVWEREAGKVI